MTIPPMAQSDIHGRRYGTEATVQDGSARVFYPAPLGVRITLRRRGGVR